MARDVILELPDQESVHDLRLIVGDLLIAESRVELKGMATGAMCCEANWNHVGSAPTVRRSCARWSRRGEGFRGIWPRATVGFGAMAVVARHLDAPSVRCQEVRLQVKKVIQLDLRRVRSARRERRELRMISIKTRDSAGVVGVPIFRYQMSMTLTATGIRSGRESHSATVL